MNPPSFPSLPRGLASLALAAAIAWATTPQGARAAEPPADRTVELPPMIIEESATLPPWLYVRADGTEYLSRCSEKVTRGYVEMRRARMQWLHALFPPELFLRMDVPVVTVLMSQKLKSTNQKEVVGEVLSLRKDRNSGGYVRSNAAPNMMLNDLDAIGVLADVDEENFDRTKLTISSDYVRFLLARRTPALPLWLREGMVGAYNDIIFAETPITLRPLVWSSPEESRKLAQDPEAPRILVSAGDLFGDPFRLPSRPEVAPAQCALLVRWALDPRHGVRDTFWRFAVRSAEVPVTEAMFQSCFNFGFSDLRDRLSDYLPAAVKAPLTLPLGNLPALPSLEIRRATPTEIARLRGEWERLSVPLVRARHPAESDRYLNQARRTLHRAFDNGDRDLNLVATLGLCEIDAGNGDRAREFLESAVAGGVVRPRAYYELARLRWAELARDQPPTRQFSAAELSPVFQMLRTGLAQSPPLPKAFGLWSDLWLRAATAPAVAEVQWITSCTAQFTDDPAVCLRVVRALARHGKTAEAVAVLGDGFLRVPDEATRRQFAAVYQMLTPSR